MKEMLIILKIAFALYKEIDMQEKLLKHRNKMLDTYKKYQNCPFKYNQTDKWREDLKASLVTARKEMQNWR